MTTIERPSTSYQHAIDDGVDPGWKPKGIIYRRLIYEVTPEGLSIIYDGASEDLSRTDVDAFCRSLVDGTYEPQTEPLLPGLGLSITQDCYVVFQLHPSGNMIFRPDGTAVTTSGTDGMYFGLRHMTKGGEPMRRAPPLSEGECKVAYFCARKRPASPEGADEFNLYIDLNGRATLPIIIDPGIQNPGI